MSCKRWSSSRKALEAFSAMAAALPRACLAQRISFFISSLSLSSRRAPAIKEFSVATCICGRSYVYMYVYVYSFVGNNKIAVDTASIAQPYE